MNAIVCPTVEYLQRSELTPWLSISNPARLANLPVKLNILPAVSSNCHTGQHFSSVPSSNSCSFGSEQHFGYQQPPAQMQFLQQQQSTHSAFKTLIKHKKISRA